MIKIKFMLLSLLLVTTLMALLVLNSRRVLMMPDQVMVRPMEVIAVTPPPPPPKNISKVMPPQTLALDLRHQGKGPSLSLAKSRIKITQPQLSLPQFDEITLDFDVQSTVLDLNGFSLNELDHQPQLITPLNIEFTTKMQSAGVKKVQVKLHVVIDQQGNVHLKNIEENPYPELNLAITRLTKRARFSVPQRQGKKVQAEFIWPLVLKES